ncbi:Putative glutamine amidotransferase [Pseudidiomarina piscicola]|uniref:Glutamine amidotransferase n=1 Tax=Pseudidiomarina piscicola TaxID=2614830 RepID=A0A6S6WN30_9GAMM|nr:gamma-glutamyl-gamma-aminobutyrate hydrolase family protein [Pseudidiomarina piscicola]CAB0151459.1 Putative glutamine amidotransferase [Pseudidiomarina piscicola]VZT40938.1 Putative glutamine amidotransferase [Pseudomonas aeruginosa]
MAQRKPRIGVTGAGKRWSPSWWSTRLALWLCGAEVERISVRHRPSGLPLHGIVIGGGSDISPEHYGGTLDGKVKHDPERDDLEIRWIKKALRDDIPILGVCRGAQLINVLHEGNLYDDIRDLRKQTYNRPGLLPTKQVFIRGDSDLASIVKKRKLRVNSLHHQAVHNVGHGLRIVAHDLDEIPQAIESTGHHAIIGVQWHPEYLFYLPSELRLFRWLIKAARQLLRRG